MKKKYPGYASHIEYHTVNPKKGKAADCIYLTQDRICKNKKSLRYTEKCFSASYCALRKRKTKLKPPTNNITPTVSSRSQPSSNITPAISRQIPTLNKKLNLLVGSDVRHNTKGCGVVKKTDLDGAIWVEFESGIVKLSPDSFEKGFLKRI